jgi:crotonobetainyl-CoA:carnitine CoA-transferase CaiB-like acyl-CoA transferase
VVSDRHLVESDFFSMEQTSEGPLRAMRTPTGWSDSPPEAQSPAPRLGEHSAEVLREAGYSDREITELARTGVTLLMG